MYNRPKIDKNIESRIEAFNDLCDLIKKETFVELNESEDEKRKRIESLLGNYGKFVMYYFPHYASVPLAEFHVQAARRVLKNPRYRGVEEWARGHAKSVTFNVFLPMFLKCKKELNVMVLVGKSQDNAQELLSDLQAELMFNQRFLYDFGEQYKFGDWQSAAFSTKDGCAFFARGRNQSPRGLRKRERRPDYIVCDDIDDDELCENPRRVRKTINWIKEALFGAMDMGRGRFIIVGNRIHKEGIVAQMALTPGISHHVVNAIDKTGAITWAEKYTEADLAEVRRFQGYIGFEREYMNNPITEGAVFKNTWIRYKKCPKLSEYEILIAYCDPSFKAGSDYKAIVVIGLFAGEFHLKKCYVRQSSVQEMVSWYYDTWQDYTLKKNVPLQCWMEEVFIQDLLFEDFKKEGEKRGVQLPLRGDTRKKQDKYARIESLSPIFERGEFFLDDSLKTDPDTLVWIEQLLAIEKGSRTNDDGADATEGAIWLLYKQAINAHAGMPVFIQRKRKGY